MKFLTGGLIAFVFVVAFVAVPAFADDRKKGAHHVSPGLHGGISNYNPYYPGFSGYYGLRHSRIQFGHHAGHLASRIARDPLGRYSSYYSYGGGFYGGYGRGRIDYRDLASTPYYRDPRYSQSSAPRYSSGNYDARRSTYFSGNNSGSYPTRPLSTRPLSTRPLSTMAGDNSGNYATGDYAAPADDDYGPDEDYASRPAALPDGCERVSKWGRDDYGKRARIGGTMCYDDYGKGYIVEGSRFVIGYR